MDFHRILVYEDKESLVDFNINDENTLNGVIYDEWLIKRTEIDSITEHSASAYLKVFNDAYYICTLALMIPVTPNDLPNTLRYGNLNPYC